MKHCAIAGWGTALPDRRVTYGSGTRTVDGTAGVDLRAGLARQLAGLGVVRVDTDPRCTIADDSLFSYRRQGRTGRQASVILRQL